MTTLSDGRVTVPMNVERETANMLVDTGGVFSMLAPGVADSLHREPRPIPYTRLTMYGGIGVNLYVIADYSLGAIARKNFQFPIMPIARHSRDVDGLLAPDIMQGFGVEFDFANSTFGMFLQDGCEGPLTYWTRDPYEKVEFTLNEAGHIVVPIVLDGKDIRADIDTGSPVSVARLEWIEDDFGIDKNHPSLRQLRGARPLYSFPFKRLSLGDIAIADPNIVLVPDSQSKVPSGLDEVILGMDLLRHFHLYIDYHRRVLYATSAVAH